MTDQKIIELFFARDEKAITEVQKKYSDYCYTVAHNILENREDAEECVNDTYLAAWNSIPPEKPNKLSSYLARLARNFALMRCREMGAQKRSASVVSLGDELLSVIPDGYDLASEYDARRIGGVIDAHLRELSARDRRVCVLRYFHGASTRAIATDMQMPESTVRTVLMRSRKRLAEKLRKEGVIV